MRICTSAAPASRTIWTIFLEVVPRTIESSTKITRLLEGKRVILVDDSIVRGTNSKKIVQMVRDAGAAEVHMRIASPPTASPCFYGIDTPERQKLLASRMNVKEMAEFIRVDSLAFVSLDGF